MLWFYAAVAVLAIILFIFKIRVAVAGGKMAIAIAGLIALVWFLTRPRR